MTTICIRLSEKTMQHVQSIVDTLNASGAREMTVALLCKQVIENYVVDRRVDKWRQRQMPEHHYTARDADDSWEAE